MQETKGSLAARSSHAIFNQLESFSPPFWWVREGKEEGEESSSSLFLGIAPGGLH